MSSPESQFNHETDKQKAEPNISELISAYLEHLESTGWKPDEVKEIYSSEELLRKLGFTEEEIAQAVESWKSTGTDQGQEE